MDEEPLNTDDFWEAVAGLITALDDGQEQPERHAKKDAKGHLHDEADGRFTEGAGHHGLASIRDKAPDLSEDELQSRIEHLADSMSRDEFMDAVKEFGIEGNHASKAAAIRAVLAKMLAKTEPTRSQHVGEPERYEAQGTWITIGGHAGPHGEQHAGGSAVLIDGQGRIIGGNVPSSMHGTPVHEFATAIAKEKHKTPPVPKLKAPLPPEMTPAQEEPTQRVPVTVGEATRRIDRFENFFRAKGQHEVADWMGKLRDHVNAVGTDAALASLGEEADAGLGGKTQYEGKASDMSDFCAMYLNRHGITPIQGGADPKQRVVSSQSNKFGVQARPDPYMVGDFSPKDPSFKDKLEESKHLPGLESSEDIGKIVGKPVTHLTPDVTAKMDERYGAGKWIIKAYGDDAFAGYGIFFPQRVAQISQDARDTLWSAGEQVSKYGFSLRRDEAGTVVGLEHNNGDRYDFDSVKYNDTIQGDARHWGDKAAAAAPSERGAALPGGGKDFMAQPAFEAVGVSDADRAAGKTIAPGEGRVHIVTRGGKAEIIPHSTWIKGEHLPVVFESEETKAMAKAAVDAINALPESERQGQIYAPDIIKGKAGYNVVEANPANETGSSGYLGDNPFIIDSYVSKLTGREPAHVRFIRKLLSSKQ